MQGKHAEYSPSKLGEEMKCLGRHLATLGMNSESSEYADRGTEVHDFCEQNLEAYLKGEDIAASSFVEEWQEQCALDMMEHVKYVYDMMAADGPVHFWLEETVSLKKFKNEQFDMSQVWGTADVIIWAPMTKTLAVIDYKSGAGVPVSPVNNVQMSIYGLGALGLIDQIPEKILLCVSQPRIEPDIQIWETDFVELNTWCHQELMPALIKMSKPGAEFTPGESQCRWCPIKGRCKAQRDEMLQLFDTDPANQEGAEATFSDDQINTLMLRLPEFKQWINQVEAAGMEILERGDELPDFKLVRGKSNRRWIDTEKADTYLRGQKLKEKERYTYKLLSPAQAEKALKDKLKNPQVAANFNKLWEKPEGKLSYAHKDDPRPSVVIDKKATLVNLEDLL